MKTVAAVVIAALSLCLALTAADRSVAPLDAAQRVEQWKKVEEAVGKGLPKTALELLEPIQAGAVKDKAWGEAAKALARRIALEGEIQGDKPEERIVRLEAELAKTPREMVPILRALLGNFYWQYFEWNRWRFFQRTATAQAPGKDFTTWDLPRLFAEIDRQFQQALAADAILKATPIGTFEPVLTKGNMPDAYRPTLYDFIAYQALRFYAAGEQAAAKPEDAFDLAAAGPIFAPVEQFMAWRPETTDTESPTFKAVCLFQKLLEFHRADKDPSAYASADLERLLFGWNKAVGEEKGARFKEAAAGFVKQWADHPLSALARYHWGRVLREEGNPLEAHQIAKPGADAFPDMPGGKWCRQLIAEIEAKSLQISTERVWNQPWPSIQVRYRNLNKVFFRAVAAEWPVAMEVGRGWWFDGEQMYDCNLLLGKTAAMEWSADLPATPDFKERTEQTPVPEKLAPGFYFIVASADPAFKTAENQLSYAGVWVSDLALVTRWYEGRLTGFVLDALSGEPLSGCKIEARLTSMSADWQKAETKTFTAATDEHGAFNIALEPPERMRSLAIKAEQESRTVGMMVSHWGYHRRGRQETQEQTVFFTDRALYRPGQTIQYKGICLSVNHENDDYKLLAGRTLTVVFQDVNGKEIARQTHRCNDYGSFAGSFTAPRDRLMGNMSLRVIEGPRGQASFSVEEYKRPKFRVTLEAPKTAPRLDDAVQVTGKAEAYTGAAIDDAEVRYRVVRQVRMPEWWRWCWWFRPIPTEDREIAHGTTKTATDGTFTVAFRAVPDRSIAASNEPTFVYRVYADVTDSAGETRSAERCVNVGYTALKATMNAEEWLTDGTDVTVKVQTTTLDGEGQAAEGVVKVYVLKAPEKVPRAKLGYEEGEDPADPRSWPLGELVAEKSFTTDPAGNGNVQLKLGVGLYRAVLETQDRFKKKVTALLPLRVLNPAAPALALKVPHVFAAPKWSMEPGQEFVALWGTGYEKGRAYVEVEHRGKLLQSYWTEPGRTQARITQAVSEAMRGGFVVRVTYVRENRAYCESRLVEVPWSNKALTLSWEHFTSKLQPGQKETWTAVITGPKAEKAVAEMVAALYDEALDAFRPHGWLNAFACFRREGPTPGYGFANCARNFHPWTGWTALRIAEPISYRDFLPELAAQVWGYRSWGPRGRKERAAGLGGAVEREAAAYARAETRYMDAAEQANGALALEVDKSAAPAEAATLGARVAEPGPPPGPDLSQVTARKNLNETAFFFPQLVSDSNGVVRMTFTMPEALTQWKFLGFAHDTQMRSGFLGGQAVTAKELMVQPNPPRFLREGDVLEFTVKVSNQSAARQTGKVRLSFSDARTEASVDAALENQTPDREFDIPAKESRSFAWKIKVPDGMGLLTYKTVGSTGRISDGEEGYLPVLSRRMLVRESLPLPIRGPATKKFKFEKLAAAGKSNTLRHQSLTVQMVSNPSWYAVLALPYLMEFPYECSEQIFNRFYANSLARFIARSDPKIRNVFEQWKNTPAPDSPLEKNQDLKVVLLEETPWVRQAQSESEARRNVGILFDDNRLEYETGRTLQKLREMQLPDGMWPWFPGGPGNEYITLYITTGFGRLRHLGLDINVDAAVRALGRLDAWINEMYRDIVKRGDKDTNHLSPTICLYLYGRSFFLKDKPIPTEAKEAVDYFLGQARTHWLKAGCRQSQGHLALALLRFGDKPTATDIMRSIKEHAVTNEELGMFWRDTELSWWWYRAPIETQALMIEAFDEVMGDAQAVEDCKVWLLKQKQTQDWKTTKATADAVYALLLRGARNLASEALVTVALGGKELKPEQVEAGTGFYERRFQPAEIRPTLGEITVKKVDEGVAWGSVHWQYLEDMTKVTPYEGTPLKLKKALFVKTVTSRGPVLEPVKGPIKVGDELVVRVELRTDRDMEYVHLKDQRGSGTEPVNVLSRYRYQDGLAYYECTRDTASHFFIDYLPKGTYVFEYSTRVQQRGKYQSGMAEIQCMYAPEFNSHSESVLLEVQ